MEALEFCKRISEVVGIPYLTNQVREHYTNGNGKIELGYDLFDDIWWVTIYIKHSNRLFYIGYSEKDGYWLQENDANGDVFDHKCSKTLTPCLRELKKILTNEGILLF